MAEFASVGIFKQMRLGWKFALPKKAEMKAFRTAAAGKFVVLVEEGEVNKNGGAGGSGGRGARFNSSFDDAELIFGISSSNRFGLEKHFTFIFE